MRHVVERYGTEAPMSNRTSTKSSEDFDRPRVVYFGMRCAFSVPPLEALLAARYEVRAVIVPGPLGGPVVHWRTPRSAGVVPLAADGRTGHATLDQVAGGAGVPLLEIANLKDREVIEAFLGLSPDVIAVACFPWRIPRAVRDLPRLGCLNVHPSLLPRWRGPEPIFWTFHAGDTETGSTVHVMDGGFDTGPVVVQERITISPGSDGPALERNLAELGGKLLVRAIDGLADGALSPVPQDQSNATLAPVPDDVDLELDLSQPARRVFEFVRGVAPLWGPLTVVDPETGRRWSIDAALDFDSSATQDAAVVASGRVLHLRCSLGVVRVAQCYMTDSAPLTQASPV
jgi:methionyl-tRNA formyltransferase